MTNLRHLGPINTSNTQLDQNNSFLTHNGSLQNKNAASQLAALEQSRQQMRTQNDPLDQTLAASNNERDESAINTSQLRNAYEETTRYVIDQYSVSSEATSNADRLKGEANNLKAQAVGRSSGIAQQLKDEAKRKEIQAIQEERRAQQALFNAQEAQRQADSLLERLNEAESNFNNANQKTDDLKGQLGNSSSRLSDISSQLNQARSSIDSNQPAGIDGGETPQPIIMPSQPAGIDGGNTPQPVIKPSQPPGIDPDGGKGSTGDDDSAEPSIKPKPVIKPSQPPGIDPTSPYLRVTDNVSSGSVLKQADVASLAGKGVNSGGASSSDQGDFVGGNSFLQAARALLRAIMLVTINARDPNPIVQIAKNLTNKGLSEQAISYLEAALVDSAIQGSATNQQIILTKAQANTIHGEAETNIAYWKEVIQGNKQLEKDTHDLAKRA